MLLRPTSLVRLAPPLALLLALVAFPATARADKVRVRGSTSSETRVIVEPNAVTVRGRLLDDAGQPIAGSGAHARIRFQASRGGPYLRLPKPQPCDATSSEKIHYAASHPTLPDEYRVDPEEGSGAFCVRVPGISTTGVVELSFEGSAFYAGHTSLTDFDPAQRSLNLRFSPEPARLSLDRLTHVIGVDTDLEPAAGPDEHAAPVQLELLFTDSGGPRSLGTLAVRPGEHAQFDVPSQALGRPGPGRLTVRFAGSPSIHSAERALVIQKTLRVTLSVAGPVQAGDPRDGLEIKVAVGSAQGAVSGGSVEARASLDSVGTAPVNAGVARVVAAFEATHAGQVSLSLLYLPGSPWLEAPEPLRISVPVTAPSPWRRLPWLLLALAIAGWVIRSWRRPPRAAQMQNAHGTLPSGRAALDVIERGPVRSGWRGQVVDAHEGTPIEGARVAILTPAFGGDGIVRSVTTDASGHFVIEQLDGVAPEGSRMQTGARWHASLVRPLPPPGEVLVSLVSRRRALLERLVEWANFRGRPWKQPGETTPGHIARTAHSRRAPDIEKWASAVENAAYGPEPPDEEQEHAIRAGEPEWGNAKPVLHRIGKAEPR